MEIQVNTNHTIDGNDELRRETTKIVERSMARFAEQITRIEIHLSDVNGERGGEDKRCVLEARLAGRQPVAVTHESGTVPTALAGATRKMTTLLDSTLGRLRNH